MRWPRHPIRRLTIFSRNISRPAKDSTTIPICSLTANVTPKDAAASQIAMLNERKAKDPLVNHEANVNEATGEVMLDFLVSGASKGKLVVEWNAYRYAPLRIGTPASTGCSMRVPRSASARPPFP